MKRSIVSRMAGVSRKKLFKEEKKMLPDVQVGELMRMPHVPHSHSTKINRRSRR